MVEMKKTLRQNLRNLDSEEYEVLERMTHRSKDLYNETLYEVRQYFFKNGEYLNYYNAYKRLKGESRNYEVLPSQVAQQTMKHVDKAFQSFFKLVEKKREGKYTGDTHPPNYLDKHGHYSLNFPRQSFQIREDHIRIGIPKDFREEYGFDLKEIQIPFTYEEIKEDDKEIKQLQIIPKVDAQYFEYRLIYEEEKQEVETVDGSWLGLDLGLDNLATCVDHSGRSFILDGRELKSYNRWFNKEKARLQTIKDKQGIEGNTKRINKLYKDRDNYVHDYLNKAVHHIAEYCKEHKIEKVFVGDAKGWKQEINIGDSNNEKFVQIPFDKFKQKLKHKLEYYGIDFELVDESYTSKCSALDQEDVEKHEDYEGDRIERGLFKASDGTLINADLNAALNIVRKGKPEFDVGCSGDVATPQRIRVH